jgi:hypothetical protein
MDAHPSCTREQVASRMRPRAQVLDEAIRFEGEHELGRPIRRACVVGPRRRALDGVLARRHGLVHSMLPARPWAPLLISLGYPVGFFIVIGACRQLASADVEHLKGPRQGGDRPGPRAGGGARWERRVSHLLPHSIGVGASAGSVRARWARWSVKAAKSTNDPLASHADAGAARSPSARLSISRTARGQLEPTPRTDLGSRAQNGAHRGPSARGSHSPRTEKDAIELVESEDSKALVEVGRQVRAGLSREGWPVTAVGSPVRHGGKEKMRGPVRPGREWRHRQVRAGRNEGRSPSLDDHEVDVRGVGHSPRGHRVAQLRP